MGMIPNPDGICLMVARVFDERGTQDSSQITRAVEWCADNGARVINMSLGGDEEDKDDKKFFKALWDEGILVVAAAGNNGDSTIKYPASYPGVLSVAAVDEDFNRAKFSVANEFVDLSAPGTCLGCPWIDQAGFAFQERILTIAPLIAWSIVGVNILSTTAANSLFVQDHPNNREFDAQIMQYSFAPQGDWNQVPIVDCKKGLGVCENAAGRICIIERGEKVFSEKAKYCQVSGGIAALIYNHEPGSYDGSLGSADEGVKIPVMSITREAGLNLLDGTANAVSFTIVASGYKTLDGT